MTTKSLPLRTSMRVPLWAVLIHAAPRPLVAVLAAGVSGVLLALPYNFPDWYLLTWVAFVPVLWATREASLKAAYGLGLCTGLVLYVVAAFWIVDFIELYKGFDAATSWIGAALFWLYCAQLPACLLLLFRWLCLRTRVPELWLLPVLVAIFFSYFPMLFPVQLAASQSRFLLAIQATEFLGAASLDFIIALSSVLLWAGLRELNVLRRGLAETAKGCRGRHGLQLLAAGMLIAAWLVYGGYAMRYWDAEVTGWPERKVGMVQPNEVPSEALPPPAPGYSRAYPPEMALTEQLAAAGAEVIVWPETRYKGYFHYPHVRQAFSQRMAELGVPLVFQDIERSGTGRTQIQYNTAVWLGPNGELAAVYRKIKRVPLGEYIPLLDHAPSLQLWLNDRLPQLFANFKTGAGPVVFTAGEFAMTPLICYEVIFPEFTAQALAQGQGRLLIVLSNNGWFGTSFQPFQHLHASVLRSVENRVPMLHVTNNGPSGLVLPSGRLVVETVYQQKLAAMLAVPYSPLPSRTFFNRFPGLFLQTLLVVTGVCVLAGVLPERLPQAVEINRHFPR